MKTLEIPLQHATDWDCEQDLSGWWMQEKFDGCRALWDPAVGLQARSGKLIQIPSDWQRSMPESRLDCELYAGVGNLAIASQAARNNYWSPQLQLVAFDLPTYQHVALDSDLAKRMAMVARIVENIDRPWLTFAPVSRIRNNAHLLQSLAEIQRRGGEGIVAHAPGQPYVFERTNKILKVKYAR